MHRTKVTSVTLSIARIPITSYPCSDGNDVDWPGYLPWVIYAGVAGLVGMVLFAIDFERRASPFEAALVLFVIAAYFLLWGNL